MKHYFRHLVRHGWISDQHGAWPITIIPAVCGMIYGLRLITSAHMSPAPSYTLDIACVIIIGWICAFLGFSALTHMCKMRHASARIRYRPATLTYCSIATISALYALYRAPGLWAWCLIMVPLGIVSATLSTTGRDRHVLTRLTCFIFAFLIFPILVSVLTGRCHTIDEDLSLIFLTDQPHIWACACALGIYYISTIPYVKTMIRQRGSRLWLTISVLSHIFALSLALWGHYYSYYSLTYVVMMALATGRCVLMPWLSHYRKRPLHPRTIGIVEIALSLGVLCSLL